MYNKNGLLAVNASSTSPYQTQLPYLFKDTNGDDIILSSYSFGSTVYLMGSDVIYSNTKLVSNISEVTTTNLHISCGYRPVAATEDDFSPVFTAGLVLTKSSSSTLFYPVLTITNNGQSSVTVNEIDFLGSISNNPYLFAIFQFEPITLDVGDSFSFRIRHQ